MKIVKVKNETIKLLIWDLPSEKLYDTSSKNLYKGSRGIIFIYDVTDQNSFKNTVNSIKKVEWNMNYVVFPTPESPMIDILNLGSFLSNIFFI